MINDLIQSSVAEISKRQAQFLDSMMVWFMIHGTVDSPHEIEIRMIAHVDLNPLSNTTSEQILAHFEIHARGQRYASFKVILAFHAPNPTIDYKYEVPPTFALISQGEQ